MKVLITSCGIGMGHASRDMALADKLRERGFEVMFASYGSGHEMILESGNYDSLKLPDIKFYGNERGLDIKYTAKRSISVPFVFLKSMYHESKIIKKFKPNIVIADSHYSVPITCKILGIPCIMITNELTLNFSPFYPNDKTVEYLENVLERFIRDVFKLCKVVIIPDFEGSIKIPSKLENMVTYTGPFLKKNPAELESKEELRKKFGFSSVEKIVLVTVGGSEFGRKLLDIIMEASERMDHDKMIVVTGPCIGSDFISDSDKVIKKKYLDNMMEWMKLSDVIISHAGHNTTMEIASLGIPNILIPIDNHPEQLRNASNMDKYGISIVRDIKKLDPDKLAVDINALLHDDDLRTISKIGEKQFSIYKGCEDAVEIILKYAT